MRARLDLRYALRMGSIIGVVVLGLCMIGMVKLFAERDIVSGALTLGHILLFAAPGVMGYLATEPMRARRAPTLLAQGFLTGLVASLPPAILVLVTQAINLRQFMPNVSPDLISILTFDQPPAAGLAVLAISYGAVSMVGAAVHLIAERPRRGLVTALSLTLLIGLLSENLVNRLRDFFGQGFIDLLFRSRALRPTTALILFALIAAIAWLWQSNGQSYRQRLAAMPPDRQRRFQAAGIALSILLLLALPVIMGTYLSEVIDNIGIFVLMGLGLNIVVGFAGLLDLGYVAFFAIGAYTMAVLTTEGELSVLGLSFWAALPVCIAVSATAGLILGIPVLRMRGDYLAIVTLGFGEIIRILALSDFLKPYIGGALGVLSIPKPEVGSLVLVKPEHMYYIILAGCLMAVFISWRLREARLGRQWMALREDEDVAEAMGIRLVNVKLLAFAIGAAFSGLAGAIFASKLTSIFPHSFQLLISINVLSLIIVGGIASLPGVVVGSLVLVGLPELLREFKEYRLLMYGALLIVMMLVRPEGFWPSSIRRRELRREEPELEMAAAANGD